MKKKKCIALATMLIGISQHVLAQGLVNEPATSIVVEGTTQSLGEVVGARELEKRSFQNLGETLSAQPGVAQTAYGATSSRPVIRGLEGERVQIFENGMSSGDLSALSNDHASANDALGASAVEILRGPSALQYGSASSGGLINIKNPRISQELPGGYFAIVDGQYGSADRGTRAHGFVDGQAGDVALRADYGQQNLDNYKMPNGQRLSNSFLDQKDFGFGASHIRDNGFTGISFNQRKSFYGIPSAEGGMIDLLQDRVNFHHAQKNPFAAAEQIDFKLAYTDYQHRELSAAREPVTQFKNQFAEGRVDVKLKERNGWKGIWGVQYNQSKTLATDLASGIEGSVIPKTNQQGLSVYWIEGKSWGAIEMKLGGRYEYRDISPDQASYSSAGSFTGIAPLTPTSRHRTFNLMSYSPEINWNYQPGMAIGLTYSQLSRAPGISELFAYGPHESTASFDVGNSNLGQETSRQWELAWKKTKGYFQGQIGVFQNTISNFIYGQYTGSEDTNSGFGVRQFVQGRARIQGIEGAAYFNRGGSGLSGRVFGDLSHGSFVQGGALPLQPAPRLGMDLNYQQGPWEQSLTWVHAWTQTRLASFETSTTPSYNRLDVRVAYNTRWSNMKTSFYFQARNLLNEEIRYATTVESLRNYAPQPGRSYWLGFRVIY